MNADTGEFVPNDDLGPNQVFLAKLWSFLTTKNPIISSPVFVMLSLECGPAKLSYLIWYLHTGYIYTDKQQ